jgi:hypothetical protein
MQRQHSSSSWQMCRCATTCLCRNATPEAGSYFLSIQDVCRTLTTAPAACLHHG